MWLLIPLLWIPTVLCQDAPVAKKLGVTDTDLLNTARPTHNTKVKVRANGVTQFRDEVDDYTDFDAQRLRNRASHNLQTVTFAPYPQKYDIPTLEAGTAPGRAVPTSGGAPAGYTQIGNQQLLIPQQQQPQPQVAQRRGYYYQHYPWNRLPKQYLLRPALTYVYPPQYQNTIYTYPHRLPYSDRYNIYRSNPLFNPTSYASYSAYAQRGCGQQGGCGGGGGCQDCGGSGGGGYDTEYSDGDDYSSEEDTQGGRSGEAHLNKKDPLDDLDLEDLEKLENADSSELKQKSRR